jgi:8-amino-7-oxononanoate synthase
MLDGILRKKLEQRSLNGTLRTLTTVSGKIDFTSNDYLGLARSAELFTAIQKKISALPFTNGAGGSRLLSGNDEYTELVEKKLAGIFNAEAALLFNSGYAANQAVASCIAQKDDLLIYDELIHACARDGARLSWAQRLSFRHNDLTDLEEKLKKSGANKFVFIESLYSMDGDYANLQEIVSLTKKHEAHLIIDEAHSTGLCTPNGGGLAMQLNLHRDIPVRVYTFGKAVGVHGACVVGSKTLIDYLINFARPFIYTTALPHHSVAGIECAFDFISSNNDVQKKLLENINLFIELRNQSSFAWSPSVSQIQALIIPGNQRVRQAAQKLQQQGFDVRPIVSPTVPEGSERIRICLHAYNTQTEISDFFKAIQSL